MHSKQVKASSPPDWSVQDRRNLDSLTTSLALKVVQIVVESRLGQKIKTSSRTFTSDYECNSFNLSIRDIPEVLAEAKKSMAGQIPIVGLGMCVEISLKTVEGDTMVLETWYLEMAEQCDLSARVTYTVYSRMSILLKSLIAVTRVTPAYKVASLQGPGSFVICYRVYMGEPQGHCLGDCYQNVKVGQVGTPIGTLILTVAYRTQLTITPQKGPSKDCSFMVKSDHFKPDMSPKHVQRPSHIAFHPETSAWNPEMNFSECRIVGAFAMDSKAAEGPASTDYLVPEAPFGVLLELANKKTANLNSHNQNCSNNNLVSNNNRNTPVPNTDDANSRSMTSDAESQKSSSEASCADDFVLVELKPPFAMTDDKSPSELGAFFRECQSAPTLVSFSEQPTFADQVDELTAQLASFESSMPDFDDFVKSLQQDESTK